MLLDGDAVDVGDMLYHLLFGYGKVETIRDGVARVRMERGAGVINMGSDGVVRGQKVFYWSNPIFIIPSKHQKAKLDAARMILSQAIEVSRQYEASNVGVSHAD